MRPWWRRTWVLVGAVAVGVVMPLLVALVVLRGESWYPVLDLAMTEFRVRDVGTGDTPLIGLPGRIGEYPDQGSHPGPLSFYLLAPTYRALGSTSWALEAGTVLIHVIAAGTALWIGHRRGGWRGVAFVALLLAVVVRGDGQVPLDATVEPVPAAGRVGSSCCSPPGRCWCGDHLMLVPLVVAATFCAQTHVPYLLPGVAFVVPVPWCRRRAGVAPRS